MTATEQTVEEAKALVMTYWQKQFYAQETPEVQAEKIDAIQRNIKEQYESVRINEQGIIRPDGTIPLYKNVKVAIQANGMVTVNADVTVIEDFQVSPNDGDAVESKDDTP